MYKGRKCFDLMMHSTHIYGYIQSIRGKGPESVRGSFICTNPQTGQHILQRWSTGWKEKQLNGSTMKG